MRMGRRQDIFASIKSEKLQAVTHRGSSPRPPPNVQQSKPTVMEKMYTRQDVVRFISLERDRCLNLALKKAKELERLGREKPAIKARMNSAVDAVDKVMLAIVNGKMTGEREYEEQLTDLVLRDYFADEPQVEKVMLDACVFPSDEKTIEAVYDETYGGAHCYVIRECLGFADGRTSYVNSSQVLQFIQKLDDGSIIPGLQSEQVVLALADRHRKLNARFPSPQNEKMIRGLEMFLEACRERVEDRMNRGVMGDLKK